MTVRPSGGTFRGQARGCAYIHSPKPARIDDVEQLVGYLHAEARTAGLEKGGAGRRAEEETDEGDDRLHGGSWDCVFVGFVRVCLS